MSSPTYIRRAPHKKAYVVIDNDTAQDPELTWAARGLLVYLLSLPDDWQVRQADLVSRAPEGRTVIDRLMKELAAAGYLERRYTQTPAGRTVEVWVHERPEAHRGNPALDLQETREPTAQSPQRETRCIEEVPTDQVPIPELAPTARPGEPEEEPRAERDVVGDLTRAWWESHQPRPMQSFVSARGIVKAALEKGWTETEIRLALRHVGANVAGWRLDQELRKVALAAGGRRVEDGGAGLTAEQVAHRDALRKARADREAHPEHHQ